MFDLLRIKSKCDEVTQTSEVVRRVLQILEQTERYDLDDRFLTQVREQLKEAKVDTVKAAAYVLHDIALHNWTTKRQTGHKSRSHRAVSSAARFIEEPTVFDAIHILNSEFDALKEDQERSELDIWFADPPLIKLAERGRRFGKRFDKFVDAIKHAMKTYVHDISELPDDPDRNSHYAPQPLTITTAHRSKSKEFDFVIMLGVVDGIWPSANAETEDKKEAERRVFYVAFTRAKKRVAMLTNSDARGGTVTPSPYISELGLPI